MPGLSDSQQSLLSLASLILIVIGAVSVPSGAPWYVGLGIGIVGAVGIAIKEYLGTSSPVKS